MAFLRRACPWPLFIDTRPYMSTCVTSCLSRSDTEEIFYVMCHKAAYNAHYPVNCWMLDLPLPHLYVSLIVLRGLRFEHNDGASLMLTGSRRDVQGASVVVV